ncbi:uncharacterized protein LY79DRAFT_531089, partial [Colletotrichum navitas]
YCNNTVVVLKGINKHIADLQEIFLRLREKNISSGPSKSYISFPSAIVLGKQADSFGMLTTEVKTRVITKI